MTHAPCLYKGFVDNNSVLVLHQVDDFCIACLDKAIYNSFCKLINRHLSIPITQLGLMRHFNGIDIEQTQHYVLIHNTLYIQKVLAKYGLQTATPAPLPMPSNNNFVKRLDSATPLDPVK